MVRRNRGFEALELPRVRGLAADDDEFRLLQYGEGMEEELVSMNPRRREGPPAFGRQMGGGGMLDQAGTSNIGRSIDLLAATLGTSSPLLRVTCPDKSTRQLSIALAVETLVAPCPRDVVALVRWGAGGLQSPLTEVDFVDGAVFSISCSYLEIVVRTDTAIAGNAALKVGAFIGYGTRPGGKAPQRTLKTGALAIAGTVDLTIPVFSHEASLLRSPSTCDVLLRYLTAAGAVISEVTVPAGGELEGRRVPIPNDAVTLRVINGGVALDAGRVVFGLSI